MSKNVSKDPGKDSVKAEQTKSGARETEIKAEEVNTEPAGGSGRKKDSQSAAGGEVPENEGNEPAAGQETPQGVPEEAPQDGGEEIKKELSQTKDQLMRLSADFDNFRKRTLRDREDWSRYAGESLIRKLLPVLDDMDHAAAAVENSGEEGKRVGDGFLMIQKRLLDILNQEGLKEIEALGQEFDPVYHEAVMQAPPQEGEKDNQVLMVLRKGYMFKDKVLRASMVKVAKD